MASFSVTLVSRCKTYLSRIVLRLSTVVQGVHGVVAEGKKSRAEESEFRHVEIGE